MQNRTHESDLPCFLPRTAGVYVVIDDTFLFMLGPTGEGDALGVVRFGGHVVAGETPSACATREVREETSLDVAIEDAPRTFWVDPETPGTSIRQLCVERTPGSVPRPLLISSRGLTQKSEASLMYLGRADGVATPSSETVVAIVHLTRGDVHMICSTAVTLGDFLGIGGRIDARQEIDPGLVPTPFLQVRVLSELLEMAPELFVGESRGME